MPLNPEATFDCLFLADHLRQDAGSFTTPEIHLFAYLACLLWLYQGRAVSDWGYPFVGTELGAPFSLDIEAAVKILSERGYFGRVHERLNVSEEAEQMLHSLAGLAINRERVDCLAGACASLAAFSVGIVGAALAEEPDLRRSRATPLSRPLLEDLARSRLYAQFQALRGALAGQSEDLRLRAVLWLAALHRSSEVST